MLSFFAPDGTIQSSLQRFTFADGELNAIDIRRLIHAASAGDDNYWGFNTYDTITDTHASNLRHAPKSYRELNDQLAFN